MNNKKITILFLTTFFILNSEGSIYSTLINGSTEYFYIRNTGANFYDAREDCFEYGGDLITIDSEEKHNLIADWYKPTNDPFWLGMKKDDTGTFRWLNGSTTLTFTKWEEFEDLKDDLMQCAAQAPSTNTWTVGNCGRKKSPWTSMCEREVNLTDPITTPPPVDLGYCPQGYVGIDGMERCFQVNIRTAEDGVDWHEARDICKRASGYKADLASFRDRKETALVATQLTGRPLSLWIGMYQDSINNLYLWADNSNISHTNWGNNEPKSTSQQMCGDLEVEPGPPGTWRSNPCTIRRGFICQILRTEDNIIPTPAPLPPNNCLPGYSPNGKSCFKLHNEAVAWSEAERTCRSEGAFLATIHSHAENAVVQLATADIENVWIGLRDYESSREFLWIDDWPVFYTNWNSGQPTNIAHHDCVDVNNKGLWSVKNCEDHLPFVCKTTTEIPPTFPPIAEGRCPDVSLGDEPWMEHGEYCYYPFASVSSTKSWLDALSTCIKLHPDASLVSIHQLATNAFVRDIASEAYTKQIWIGMHLAKGPNPTFQWIDGSPVQFTHWQANHPDPNSDPEKTCVVMAIQTTGDHYQSTWVENKCEVKNNFVCSMKKKTQPTTPPPTDKDCPDGWDHYGDKCIYIAPNNVTNWYGAEKECQNMAGPNATLASVEDDNINALIRYALHDRSETVFHRGFWLGGRSKEGAYPAWSDGSMFKYENWEENEPKIPKEDFACIEMHTFNGFWRMSDCHSSRGFVCNVRKADLPKDKDKDPDNGGGLRGDQTVGVVFGVILAVGFFASVAVLVVLHKRVEKWKDFNAKNNLEEKSPRRNYNADAVNFSADSDNVEMP